MEVGHAEGIQQFLIVEDFKGGGKRRELQWVSDKNLHGSLSQRK